MKKHSSYSSKDVLRVVLVGAALYSQSVFAEKVTLGGAYSVFDDLYIVATGSNNNLNCDNLRDAVPPIGFAGVRTVRLPPATYDCGTTPVAVPTGVTVEGSGQLNTQIIGQGLLVVELRSGGELSDLSISHTLESGAGGLSVLFMDTGASINRLTVKSEGANTQNIGIAIANSTGTAQIAATTVTVSGGVSGNFAIVAGEDAIINITNSTITAPTVGNSQSVNIQDAGLGGSGATVWIKTSKANGNLLAETATASIQLVHTQFEGSVVSGAGTIECFGAYNAALESLNADCSTPP